MRTFQPSSKEIKRNWHLVDVKGKILGRISTHIAKLLMGKQKVTYADFLDLGDYVVVVNAADVKVSGNKLKAKSYKSHSGYPGGFREVAFQKMMEESPERIIIHSVAGMLPDNKLKAKRLARLKVFKDETHPFKDRFSEMKV